MISLPPGGTMYYDIGHVCHGIGFAYFQLFCGVFLYRLSSHKDTYWCTILSHQILSYARIGVSHHF